MPVFLGAEWWPKMGVSGGDWRRKSLKLRWPMVYRERGRVCGEEKEKREKKKKCHVGGKKNS